MYRCCYIDLSITLSSSIISFRNCWQNYVDFYRCVNLRGEDYKPCQFFHKNFIAMCPEDWVDNWDEQREASFLPTSDEGRKNNGIASRQSRHAR